MGLRLAVLVACLAATGRAAAAAEPALPSVLSAVTVSLKQDGTRDRAVLVANDDSQADLYVYFNLTDDAAAAAKMKPGVVKTNIAFAGTLAGQEATLSENGRGSLVLTSMNEAIGRAKWTQKITIAWRKDALMVVGITYQMHDGIDPNAGGSCDLNLLSGKGVRDGKPLAGPSTPIPLTTWDPDHLPKACQF